MKLVTTDVGKEKADHTLKSTECIKGAFCNVGPRGINMLSGMWQTAEGLIDKHTPCIMYVHIVHIQKTQGV